MISSRAAIGIGVAAAASVAGGFAAAQVVPGWGRSSEARNFERLYRDHDQARADMKPGSARALFPRDTAVPEEKGYPTTFAVMMGIGMAAGSVAMAVEGTRSLKMTLGGPALALAGGFLVVGGFAMYKGYRQGEEATHAKHGFDPAAQAQNILTAFDKNKDGHIHVDEDSGLALEYSRKNLNANEKPRWDQKPVYDIELAVKSADTNADGNVDVTELTSYFSAWDENGDGNVSANEKIKPDSPFVKGDDMWSEHRST